MKALIRKDLYVVFTQFKLMFLVMVLFSAVPAGLFMPFTFIYAAMLSCVSLMSVDEQSQWDALALMLPYSRSQLVTVKYVMGWLGIAAVLVFSVALQGLWAAAGVFDLQEGFFAALCLFIAVALVVQAVIVPINFRFGFAKGRLVTVLIIAILGGAVGTVMGDGENLSAVLRVTSRVPAPVYPLLAAALCVATIPLSVAGYRRRTEK